MKHEKLKKQMGLFDVYAISTGAMFSSGFFLLPGIASAYSGPSVILAYLFGGILVLSAMPGESLIAIIMRNDKITIPHGDTIIKEGDQLSIIGEKEDIDVIKEMIG